MRLVTVVSLALLAAGCVSLNPGAENVRITCNHNHVSACTSLGEIYTSSGWGNAVAGPGYDNNKAQLANEIYVKGGDTLLI